MSPPRQSDESGRDRTQQRSPAGTEGGAKARRARTTAAGSGRSRRAASDGAGTSRAGEPGASDGARPSSNPPARFLTIDVGGSGLKAAVVDRAGEMLTERVRVKTPKLRSGDQLVAELVELVRPLPAHDRATVGFPGVVKDGRILTAPNLGTKRLRDFDLGGELERQLGVPVLVANDASIQGWAAIEGEGVELVLTLGTGFGSALFVDGRSVPIFELAHHPFRKKRTYEDELGERALDRRGKKKWNRRLAQALDRIDELLRPDRVYIGGGNADEITLELAPHVRTIPNEMGVRGGAAAWMAREPG